MVKNTNTLLLFVCIAFFTSGILLGVLLGVSLRSSTSTGQPAVEQPYKMSMYYSPQGKFYVHHTVPMSEVPGMQVVFASNKQEGDVEYMFLAPATTTFTVGEEVQPVSISYNQRFMRVGSYQTVIKKK